MRHSCSSDSLAYAVKSSVQSNDARAGKLIHGCVVKLGLLAHGAFLTNNLLSFYTKLGCVWDARNLFDEMHAKTMFSWNTILSGYVRQGELGAARNLFDEMPGRDAVSWTTIIMGYNRAGQFDAAARTFSQMIRHGVFPSQFAITNMLASCVASADLDAGKRFHALVVELGLGSCVSVANSLLNMYSKTGDFPTAEIVFHRMRLRDVMSYNTMISSHMNCGNLELALAQFDQMSERDAASWNSMISGFNQHGFHKEALEFFSEMLRDHALKPDRYTLASSLSACANLQCMNVGMQIHAYIVATNLSAYGAVAGALISMYAKLGRVDIAEQVVEQSDRSAIDAVALTSLVNGYLRIGKVSHARHVFNSLGNCDVVTWTAMIVGYIQNGQDGEAVDLFRAMIRSGTQPNCYTFSAMLSVVGANASSLDNGKQIHARALRSGGLLSASAANALISMYAKAGSIDKARQVFNIVQCNNDCVTWTSMIMGLAQHGHGEEAVALFERMMVLGMMPDQITYVGILTACSHGGLVEKGREYFAMMKRVHSIEPGMSHYACMIDLLGRAGLVGEACGFIGAMPIEPDVIGWGSLLSSCRAHKQIELARVAAEKLLLIEPNNGGAYSALANAYLACGKWEEAAEIRHVMKKKGVRKDQGFSWFQVQGRIHVFRANDSGHPQREAIYEMMHVIYHSIKKISTLFHLGF